jgi:hypothetical protein
MYLIVLDKRVSYIDTSGLQESENHATPKNELVDLTGGKGEEVEGEEKGEKEREKMGWDGRREGKEEVRKRKEIDSVVFNQ